MTRTLRLKREGKNDDILTPGLEKLFFSVAGKVISGNERGPSDLMAARIHNTTCWPLFRRRLMYELQWTNENVPKYVIHMSQLRPRGSPSQSVYHNTYAIAHSLPLMAKQ